MEPCKYCGLERGHVFGCPGDSVLEKTPTEILKEHDDEVASKAGYRTTDFKWFGRSVPQDMKAECLMCKAQQTTPLETLMKTGIQNVCPSCNRKDSMKIYDVERWEHYLKLRLCEFDLFIDQYNTAHVARFNDGHRHVEQLRTEYMRGLLASRVKNRNQVDNALLYMDSLARQANMVRPLEVRARKIGEEIWIDLCDEDWKAVKVTKDGWGLAHTPPIIFRRFPHMAPLTIAKGTIADWKEWLSLLNLASDKDKLLYSGYAASLFFPDIEHPILMPLGPQGSAKTTTSVMTKMLIDPAVLETRNLPDEPEKIHDIAAFNYLPMFDNCGYITQEMSDILCQVITGGGHSKRKLYTDNEQVFMTYKRPLILNGISSPTMNPDFIDRSIIINLERIFEENRKEKMVINQRRDELLPKVRGFLLDVAVAAMNDGPTPSQRLPRLADFARVADACAAHMGFERGRFIEEYIEAANEMAMDAVASDPMVETLLEFLDGQDVVETSGSELYKTLTQLAGNSVKSGKWPKDSSRFAEDIFGRLKPGLMMIGWKVERKKTNGRRYIIFSKLTPPNKNSGSLF